MNPTELVASHNITLALKLIIRLGMLTRKSPQPDMHKMAAQVTRVDVFQTQNIFLQTLHSFHVSVTIRIFIVLCNLNNLLQIVLMFVMICKYRI